MKIGNLYDRIDKIIEDVENEVARLEEKRDAIEDHAIEKDREMTESEYERYSDYDNKIDSLNTLLYDLNDGLNDIEDLIED